MSNHHRTSANRFMPVYKNDMPMRPPLRADSSGTAATNLVIAKTDGRLFRVGVDNGNAAARFLQVFDASALPANATVPLLTKSVAANSYGEFDFGNRGLQFYNGIVAALSTTEQTLTTTATNDGLFVASYIA